MSIKLLLNKYANIDTGLLVFRISVSLMMLSHGIPKFIKFNMLLGRFPDPIGIGSELSLTLIIFAELFCSVLLILGIMNRLSLYPLIIGMLVAVMFHMSDPFSKKELALMYLNAYVLLSFTGLGKYRIKYFDGIEKTIMNLLTLKFIKF